MVVSMVHEYRDYIFLLYCRDRVYKTFKLTSNKACEFSRFLSILTTNSYYKVQPQYVSITPVLCSKCLKTKVLKQRTARSTCLCL